MKLLRAALPSFPIRYHLDNAKLQNAVLHSIEQSLRESLIEYPYDKPA